MRHVVRIVPKRFYNSFRFLYKVWNNFKKSGGLSCSSSLAYTLLVAFIPFSVSIASFSFWLPISDTIVNDVQFYFFNEFIPQSGHQIYDLFRMSFEHSTRLSIISSCSLIMICYAMMFSIEYHLHKMWQIRQSRKFINSILLFTGFFTLGPVVIYMIAEVTEFSELAFHNKLFTESMTFCASQLVTLISFVAIYKFIPSKSVRWSHAFGSGLIASIAFLILRESFIFSMRNLREQYSLLYGSLAILPIFLLWLYLSVLILLIGAQIIYVLEAKKLK